MECTKAAVTGLMRSVDYSKATDAILVKSAVMELCTDFDPLAGDQAEANLMMLSGYLVALVQIGFAMVSC